MKWIFRVSVLSIMLAVIPTILPIEASFKIRNNFGDEAIRQDRYKIAEWLYRSTSFMGSMRGKNNLAVMDYAQRRFEKGLNKKQQAAITHLNQAVFVELAKRSFAPAMYNNGLFHYRCRVKRSCYQKAKKRFALAAKLGDPLAPLAYAMQLTSDLGHDDGQERLKLLEGLANSRNPIAAIEYAKMLRSGGSSYNERLPYIEIGAAAGILKAQETLGIDKSYPNYQKWLYKAAENGSTLAAYRLGEYYDEDLPENERDLERAAHWYAKAIEMNRIKVNKRRPLSKQLEIHEDGLRFRRIRQYGGMSANIRPYQGAYRLGQMYLDGEGVARDEKKAAEFFSYASIVGIKNSGLMRTLLEWDSPEYVSQETYKRRLGFETILSWGKDSVYEPPGEILELIRNGDLRALTQVDIVRWQKSKVRGIDRKLVEKLSKSGNLNNYLVSMSRNLELPKISDGWYAMPIILPTKWQKISTPTDTYKLLKINERGIISEY